MESDDVLDTMLDSLDTDADDAATRARNYRRSERFIRVSADACSVTCQGVRTALVAQANAWAVQADAMERIEQIMRIAADTLRSLPRPVSP